MEADKSHYVPSVSWSSRKAGGIVQRPENQRAEWYRFQSESEGLRTRSPKAEDCCPDQVVRQRVNSTFLYLFVLFRPSVD